jgi:hypothetical protein
MKSQTLLYLATQLVVMTTSATAQSNILSEKINLFGPEEAEFNQTMKELPFGWNEHEITTDPGKTDARGYGHFRKPNRVHDRMGAALSGLSGEERRVLGQEPSRDLSVSAKLITLPAKK